MQRSEGWEGHVTTRSVEFSQPTLTTSSGSTVPLREAIFTKRANDKCELGVGKGFGAVGGRGRGAVGGEGCFMLMTGGESGLKLERRLRGEGYEQICSRNLSTLLL